MPARAGGVYLFARAFAELAATGRRQVRWRSSPTPHSRSFAARGSNAPSGAGRTPPSRSTSTRCTLKTAKLFEAACLLSSRRPELGEFGLALGIAFQIVDDCLDCAGQTVETGKIAGTDLREGIPTLPLLLAAQEDEVVRGALAGGSLDGALLRVAASGAIEEARQVARSYAERALRAASTASRRATSWRRSPKPW